jgi:GT2 family glycosyltransferase
MFRQTMAEHSQKAVSQGRPFVAVSALITAYNRPQKTLATVQRILSCSPPPSEVLVHVDGGQYELAGLVAETFPQVRLFVSEGNVGPGGGRNVLLENATCEYCASFDDESYPERGDYFRQVVTLFESFPEAAILGGRVRHRHCEDELISQSPCWVATFSGGACAYRKSVVLPLGGYVPLPIAYGMEELDLSLRLHATGGKVLYAPTLSVFHDSDLSHRLAPEVNAATLCNVALHCALRYPKCLWPLGAIQVFQRVVWALRERRIAGLLMGFVQMPTYIWARREFRAVVAARAVLSFIALKRRAVPTATESGFRLDS